MQWAAALELLAIFCMVVVFFLLFLKAFMGKDEKNIHLGAAGLSAFSGNTLTEKIASVEFIEKL